MRRLAKENSQLWERAYNYINGEPIDEEEGRTESDIEEELAYLESWNDEVEEGETFPFWEVTPRQLALTLDGYTVVDKHHTYPDIFLYLNLIE